MTDDIKKRRIATAIKWGVGFAAVTVIAPYTFIAVGGLVGLIVAGVLGLVIINGAPWAAMKASNLMVKSIAHEAAENPIETMVNLIHAKKQAFQEFKLAVEIGVTARDDFARKCDDFSRKYPARAAEFQNRLKMMTDRMEDKKRALIDARNAIALADDKLDEMRAYMDMAKSLQAANDKTGLGTGDLYEKMKADIAVDSVYSNVNRAFAQLEVQASLSLDPDDDKPAIANNPSAMLVEDIRAREKVEP